MHFEYFIKNYLKIKQNLKHTYSKVHTGRNIWQNMLDDYISYQKH